MPFSVGDGELRIVPSLEIGQDSPKEGTPLLFHWRWYYHFPSLPLWGLILLLLIVPKANRDRRTWLILIPLVVVLLAWRMPPRLLAMPDGSTETLGFFIVSVTMAWSMVWLLGCWLGGRNRSATFFLVFAIMLAVGLLSYYSHFGAIEELTSLSYLFPYGVCAFILLAAMRLSGRSCRKRFSPGRFYGWLALWNWVAALALMIVYDIVVLVSLVTIGQFDLSILGMLAIVTAISPLFLGGIMYLLNLPFLILAFKCPFYGDRFERLFHVKREQVTDPPLCDVEPLYEIEPTAR